MRAQVTKDDLQTLQFSETDRTRSILQNIAVILATRQGTCPFYRDFGLPQTFLDEPLPAAMARMRTAVKEAVEQYEPRAEVVSVTFRMGKPGELIPTVEVEILDE